MDLVKETICQLKNALLELTDNSIKNGYGNMKCSASFLGDMRSATEEMEDILSLTLDEDDLVDFINFTTLVELLVGKYTVAELNMFLKSYEV